MDELAEIIGCRPKLSRYLFNDFRLFKALLFKASVAYSYRLCGPHPWSGAREAILSLEERVIAPLMMRIPQENVVEENKRHRIYLPLLLVPITGIVLYYVYRNKFTD